MTKPKKLYRYNAHHEIETHEIGSECVPQLVRSHGYLWRCTHSASSDHYGFPTRKEAQDEELANAKTELFRLTNWIEILSGRKPGSKSKMTP
jgi:hypothetical protein